MTQISYALNQWLCSTWRKGTRYYSIELRQDIFANWIIKRNWGRDQTRGAGQSLTTVCQNYEEALKLFQQQNRHRHKRGYIQQ